MTADGSQITQSDPERLPHVQALHARLIENSPIYKILLSNSTLTHVVASEVLITLTLEDVHVNSRGGLHGAVTAALVDFSTGLSISAFDNRSMTGASVDMHISYLSTAAVGDKVEILATAERVGGSIGYTTARISKVVNGERKLVALGQHTKYVALGQKKPAQTDAANPTQA